MPINEQKRSEEIKSQGHEMLGGMVKKRWIVCWEKSAFLHLLLSEVGIYNKIMQGKDKKDHTKHHAWLQIEGTAYSIESTAGIIAPTAEYENRFEILEGTAITTPKYKMHPTEVSELLESSKKLKMGLISKIAV